MRGPFFQPSPSEKKNSYKRPEREAQQQGGGKNKIGNGRICRKKGALTVQGTKRDGREGSEKTLLSFERRQEPASGTEEWRGWKVFLKEGLGGIFIWCGRIW